MKSEEDKLFIKIVEVDEKFAKSMSLKINYRKSYLIPINISSGRTYNS